MRQIFRRQARNLDIAVRQKLAKPFDLDAMIWKP